ncbi:MAG: YbjN domain-containing protein [Corynebacterium sp.]|uniref:YbjN domain-containing protein n=1 Tax=Corynebacterium sp. TaxID=1720 RepID=UPI0026DBF548|nr:YbjN domain-containing protein [Corynebacterium sp.]MDO5097444.1 YbjN domain-containing protein [Corynebacterium sp.]
MSELTEPFTIDRVADYLRAQDYNFTTDEDGDIFTGFDENNFVLVATGKMREIYVVRATWKVTAPIDARGKLVEICNDWNREKLWPKAYVTVDDEGMVRVHAETNTDLEHGVGDRQLAQLTDCGIATALQLFNRLDEEFPDTRFS